MSETTKLPFDTPLGPVLPAAMYLTVCAWPESIPQRDKLVEALLYAGRRAAGYKPAGGPLARELERRINRACERLERGFQAAEVGQLAVMPAEFNLGRLRLRLPSHPAIGRGGAPSVKRLQALAANDWEPTPELAWGDDDFRTRVWRRYLPALPHLIALKMHIEDRPTDLVDLVRNPEWLEPALVLAERWADELSKLPHVPAAFIRLTRD